MNNCSDNRIIICKENKQLTLLTASVLLEYGWPDQAFFHGFVPFSIPINSVIHNQLFQKPHSLILMSFSLYACLSMCVCLIERESWEYTVSSE